MTMYTPLNTPLHTPLHTPGYTHTSHRNITVTVAYPGPIARESETPRLVMGAKGTLVPAAPTGVCVRECVCMRVCV